MSEWGDASGANLSPYPHSLFNDKALSDVQVKLRHGQHIFAHKPLLARQSAWFFRALTGNSPVASSKEICLDDEDDDPEAILAMIRHVYGFPYDYLYESGPPFTVVITDLMFHINVFTAADKYDVPSLRLLVVEKFVQLMDLKWSADQKEFCTAIQRLCGPKATAFAADRSLQACAASFCSKHITDLVKFEEFVSMLEEGEPFAGRLLTAVMRGKSEGLMETVRCYNCSMIEDDAIRTRLGERCIIAMLPMSNSTNSDITRTSCRYDMPWMVSLGWWNLRDIQWTIRCEPDLQQDCHYIEYLSAVVTVT